MFFFVWCCCCCFCWVNGEFFVVPLYSLFFFLTTLVAAGFCWVFGWFESEMFWDVRVFVFNIYDCVWNYHISSILCLNILLIDTINLWHIEKYICRSGLKKDGCNFQIMYLYTRLGSVYSTIKQYQNVRFEFEKFFVGRFQHETCI